MRAATAVGALILAFILAPVPVTAQECDLYPDSGCGSSVGHHETLPEGTGGGLQHHEVCYQCVNAQTSQAVTPDHCHLCDDGGAEYFDDPGGSLLLAAIQQGDLDEALRAAPDLAGRLFVNIERSAVQIRSSCDPGVVVAHVPVSETALNRLNATSVSYGVAALGSLPQ